MEKRRTCDLYFSKKEIEGIYSVRSDKSNKGDKDFFALQFKDGDEVLGNLVQFACHGTVLGPDNYLISSDIQGRIRDFFNEYYGGESYVMQGASGDMGNRQYRRGNDAAELERTAKEFSLQLTDLEFVRIQADPLKIKDYSYSMDYEFDLSEIETRFENNKERIEKLDPAVPGQKDEIKLLETEQIWYDYLLKNGLDKGSLDFYGKIIRLGELNIITCPCELSSIFAIRIKKYFKSRKLIVWPYTYYSNGYLIQKEEFGKSFESSLSMMKAGQAEEYCDYLIEKLEETL